MDHDPHTVAGGPHAQEPATTTSSALPAQTDVLAPYRAAELQSRRLWVWSAGFLGAVLVAAILGGALFRVPYVALVPGSVKDTEPLLAVSGTEQFPSDGELLFTTVRLRQQPNLWEYLWLSFDDDAEVVPEAVIFGDRSAEENRQVNLDMMVDSKQIAVAVALEELGYDAVQTDGVIVQQLVAGTPAELALQPNDSILAIDGLPTTNVVTLVDILSERGPGDQIVLDVQRPGDQAVQELPVVLAENPEDPERAFLGIEPRDRERFNDDIGFTVEIDSGSVGGPSAGLAFTLAVLDQLTDGELTGGKRLAVTGTINAAGDVGPVGGVVQKTAAVRDLGIEVFIVPATLPPDELDAVFDKAGDDVLIIPVANLGEALDALDDLGGNVDAVEEFAVTNGAQQG